MELLPLHQHRNYMESCADVLNEEWKRSKTARLHSLEKSCDNLPICLILVNKHKDLIGHSRLSVIRGREKSCLLESVVVRKKDRGKGLGKILMDETEQFAKSQGFQTIFLTTHDKQSFYQRLGYVFCETIVSVGGDFANLPESFTRALSGLTNNSPITSDVKTTAGIDVINNTETSSNDTTPIPPAPPLGCTKTDCALLPIPPAPPVGCRTTDFTIPPAPPLGCTKTDCALLPIPPAPPFLNGKTKPKVSDHQIGNKSGCNKLVLDKSCSKSKISIVRWDPSKVSWMKKDL